MDRSKPDPGSRRLGRAALILVPLAAAGILIAAWMGRSSESAPRLPVEPGAPERAQAVREFRETESRQIDARIDERLKRDASFARALRSVDREFVRSLEGLSDAEKQELWQLVQSAQARLPRENAERAGR